MRACCRAWLKRVAPLGVGRHLELRRAAERTLATAHAHVDAAAVADAIAALPTDARAALLRGVQAGAPAPTCTHAELARHVAIGRI